MASGEFIKRTLAVGASMATLGGGYAAVESAVSGGSGAPTAQGAENGKSGHVSDDPNCNNLNLVDTAQNLDRTFLPTAGPNGISNDTEAADYTKGLSTNDKNSPLGKGDVDPAALAAIDAVFADPATEKTTNVDRKFGDDFRSKLNRLRGGEGQSLASRICERAFKVLGSTVKYKEDAIREGEDYIRVNSVVGKGDSAKVEDIAFEKVTSPAMIAGATYSVRLNKQVIKINGKDVRLNGSSHELVIQPSGEMDLTGVSEVNVTNKHAKKDNPSGDKHKKNHEGGGSAKTGDKKGSDEGQNLKDNENGGGDSGGTGQKNSGTGKGVKQGPHKERDNGPNRGVKHGPTGQGHNLGPEEESAPNGTDNTPGGGDTGGDKPPAGNDQGGDTPPTGTDNGGDTPPTGTDTGGDTPPPTGNKDEEPVCDPNKNPNC
jgi:hypothetical protein